MKEFMLIAICGLLIGCASHQVVMPTIDLPSEPVKPKIVSQVITQGDKAFVAYSIPDALKLYEYLLQLKTDREKLVYRINSMNQTSQGK